MVGISRLQRFREIAVFYTMGFTHRWNMSPFQGLHLHSKIITTIMMEKKFLLYLLYIALIDIRARSCDTGDNISFGLCDLLHNTPLMLDADENVLIAYESLLEKIEMRGLSGWLQTRKEEFYRRHPEYKKD